MLLFVYNNLCKCSSLKILFTMLVTLQIAENSEGEADPCRMGVLHSCACSVLLSVHSTFLPVARTCLGLLRRATEPAWLSLTYAGQGDSLNGKHLSEIAATQGSRIFLGQQAHFPATIIISY